MIQKVESTHINALIGTDTKYNIMSNRNAQRVKNPNRRLYTCAYMPQWGGGEEFEH